MRQWLATGHADVARPVTGNLFDDGVQGHDFAAAEGVSGVAVLAAQGAAGQANEHGRQAGGARLALQRVENLGNSQGILHISHGRDG
ncbi:hypothetical protein D3C86_1471890 [compost metagenome]